MTTRERPGGRSGRPGGYGTERAASAIGVCGSTGGPQALARLLGGLPADYPVPVLVVQHLSPGFAEGFARWLDSTVSLPVGLAQDGAPATAGAWIAPDGAHLKLALTGRLCLDRQAPPGRHRPSGDVLFESIAAVAGRAAVAIVLTGIGRDGASGAATVRRQGGLAIAQDRQSSVVFGMPQAAAAGGIDLLSPEEMVTCLTRLRYKPMLSRSRRDRESGRGA